MRNPFLLALILAVWAWGAEEVAPSSPLPNQEVVVLRGTPLVRVTSNVDGSNHQQLLEADRGQYQLVITKEGGNYYWTNREKTPMVYLAQGSMHDFVAPTSGYVRVLDAAGADAGRLSDELVAAVLERLGVPPGSVLSGHRLVYIEHLHQGLFTVTYWGIVEYFER